MSWYGKTTSKELDLLIDKKPKLTELLLYPEFINELKAYNTKLLDYLSNNPQIFKQAIEYLTIAPNHSDSNERKYKLPLIVVQMIQTQTTCILNTFFKETGNNDQVYFDLIFQGLNSHQILPLLMGYIFRTCFCLINNRQKQVIERMYKNNKIFTKLLEHSYLMAASNTIQLFLNLDINKHQSIGTSEQKLQIKLDILNKIINKIDTESHAKKQKSSNIIENLCLIMCETIEKYYLIIDGKQLMDIISSEKTIQIIMGLIRSPQSEYAFPGFNFCISLINYYSFSSFNVDDVTTQNGKKALQKLETQSLIIQLTKFFPSALDRVIRSPCMNVYLYQLLEVLCHCISISSLKILDCIKKTKFFNCLIKLLLSHEQNNILHKLIEKSFLHIFISDRKIYSEYKRHLFCELDIIDCTAGHLFRLYPDQNTILNQAKKRHYFGHFMRILKIYSGIETKDEDIVNAIRSKSELWNKVSKSLIIPYQKLCDTKLGTYENVPQPTYQQFKISKVSDFNQKHNIIKSSDDSKNQVLPLNATMPKAEQNNQSQKKMVTDLFSAPTVTTYTQNQPNQSNNINPIINNNIKLRTNNHMSHSSVIDYRTEEKDKQLKKTESFKQFMSKKKVEAEQQIKLKRSLSQQRRLSGSKTKMSSPSPSKKNSWKQQSNNELDKTSIDKKKQIPKIPLNRKSLAQSSVSEKRTKQEQSQNDKKSTKSLVNMEQLRKIRIYQIEKPAQKKYRRIEEKDKVLLDFLGLAV